MNSTGSVVGDDRQRLFLGFRLPDSTARRVARWQQAQLGAPARARLVPIENLHVTIAFLGPRPADEVDSIAGALLEAARKAVRPVLIPARYRETRSVGMLVFDDQDGHATRFAEDVHGKLARLGVYEPEPRQWLAHLTVVRFRERPRLQPPIPDLGPVTMSDAAVYISRLRPTGAQYEVLESVPLGGG